MDTESINILFVCSMNQWRSPTAERIYARKHLVNTRSAGTSRKARRHVSVNDIKWADIVIVMERKHKQRLMCEHPYEMRDREIHVLEIEDKYKFMDPELIQELTEAIDSILDEKSRQTTHSSITLPGDATSQSTDDAATPLG